METTTGLPAIRPVSPAAPFRWLADGLRDFIRAPGPMLVYGAVAAAASFALCYGVYVTNGAFWVLALTAGFVFVAPVLAMGPYEAGRRLDLGERPTLGQVLFVRSAFRQDVAYLSLLLVLVYFLWGRVAQIVYGLSTFRRHEGSAALVDFALNSAEGHNMLLVGALTGGALAFATYALVVVSAPMLLDPRANAFAAVATSVRAVNTNFFPLLIWAVIIILLLAISAATGFLILVIAFPWLGLASWRAYRELVES